MSCQGKTRSGTVAAGATPDGGSCDERIKRDSADAYSCVGKPRTQQYLPVKVFEGPMLKKIVNTPLASRPVAPYSQAVIADRMVYVSGCVGINKETMKLVPGGVAEETRQALNSMGMILHEAGSCFSNVVKTTVLLSNIADFPVVNEVYKEFFDDPRSYPARSAYQVAALPVGAKVEIEAIAIIGDTSNE